MYEQFIIPQNLLSNQIDTSSRQLLLLLNRSQKKLSLSSAFIKSRYLYGIPFYPATNKVIYDLKGCDTRGGAQAQLPRQFTWTLKKTSDRRTSPDYFTYDLGPATLMHTRPKGNFKNSFQFSRVYSIWYIYMLDCVRVLLS